MECKLEYVVSLFELVPFPFGDGAYCRLYVSLLSSYLGFPLRMDSWDCLFRSVKTRTSLIATKSKGNMRSLYDHCACIAIIYGTAT
jgi:hypothetical protein